MMRSIIHVTGPNDEMELLWHVHYEASYKDEAPRMIGNTPIIIDGFILAEGKADAILKFERRTERERFHRDREAPEKITAEVVVLENLIACYGGLHNKLHPIALTSPEDAKMYRLAVCLVPIEDK